MRDLGSSIAAPSYVPLQGESTFRHAHHPVTAEGTYGAEAQQSVRLSEEGQKQGSALAGCSQSRGSHRGSQATELFSSCSPNHQRRENFPAYSPYRFLRENA